MSVPADVDPTHMVAGFKRFVNHEIIAIYDGIGIFSVLFTIKKLRYLRRYL